ncbi:MGH1-like glycoside hydrolase domain-containing protein [Catalinimonas niigatensis]|uniref:MGH1-like glycoside hydrolase domain-containing protein n=1 Tax=Catalinimonas niigatensis TaxID=1397264 RepID=UPI002666E265|nr:glucosidase [Catalinimonas niigatensis]WPP50591.1 glucosidase [Catalinimonas niigatensis]
MSKDHLHNPERERVLSTSDNKTWKRFGPYLSERQWGTVREDYSDHGFAWGAFTHDMARSKAYRWGEDGIGGLSDNKQQYCFSIAMWNGKDPILKERLFGTANHEGNHGEDVKEYYYYLDSTPTHSYMKMLYKYPIQAFPYAKLLKENGGRPKNEPEYELIDTGIFDKNEYFDVYVEYAKDAIDDILVKIKVINRSNKRSPFHLLPTAWFRNTWSWGLDSYRPELIAAKDKKLIAIKYRLQKDAYLHYEGEPQLLFCENETNWEKLEGGKNENPYTKDGINDYVVNGLREKVNPKQVGTKASLYWNRWLDPGEVWEIRLRMSTQKTAAFEDFDQIFAQRIKEAEIFYKDLQKGVEDPDLLNIQRQAYAGMLWSKQFYLYDINQWLNGDPKFNKSNPNRRNGRNHGWRHLVNSNIISMPDKWEYPWYAAWDLAFHCIPLARLDPAFAKRQLLLMLREYYMHPSGQIPAYEWNFSDVNPPVHAWSAWKVYSIDKEKSGKGDVEFLEKIFHKLLMNFTWWVNQKDTSGSNLFEGGFLGLDNIGVFDRSHGLPVGGRMEQADATAWMAMYSLNMLRIALEISQVRPYYQEMASKFFEHFLSIAGAMFNIGKEGVDLWDETDEFYYDAVHLENGSTQILKVRSIVGIIPLFAVEVLTPELLEALPDFTRRLQWVLRNRPDLGSLVSRWYEHGKGETRMLSLVRVHRLKCILRRMLDEDEFLSDYGVRALSKYHKSHPYQYTADGQTHSVSYLPGESDSSMFGGNSNWRGPVWFPINFLIVESLMKFHEYYGESFRLEHPTGSGNFLTLDKIAQNISHRLIKIFTLGKDGKRVCFGDHKKFQNDPLFRDNILFYEYFHGDNGRGLGASHQTGWTGLITELIHMTEKKKAHP